LRAQLHSLIGFSTLLTEEDAGQISTQGRHCILRIQAAALRMEQLVNDLLGLSRLAQADFSRRQVDLSQSAKRIAVDLQA
jgi:light-regulated signal transduction histidine kinase (bacteriophytochrome)